MKTLITSVALALFLTTAARAEETYTLKLKYTPQVGDLTLNSTRESSHLAMKASVDGQVVQDVKQDDVKTVEFVEKVLKVEGGKVVEGTYIIKSASHMVEGKETDYPFKGKTIGALKDGNEWTFTNEDGSEVDEELVFDLKDALDKKDKKEGALEPQEVLAPGKPVKVGESWDIDARKFAGGMLGDEESFDLQNSKGSLTLVSVEKRGSNGTLFGKIEGTLELLAKSMGPLELKKTLPMSYKISLDVCIDGTVPGGKFVIEAVMKGQREATADGKDIELDMDMKMGATMTQERAK